MSFKVAVASSDGKFINQHFGRSRQFLVFAVNETDESFTFQELLTTEAVCAGQHHDENQLAALANLLSGCHFVLATRIGPGAERLLAEKGIRALEYTAFIEDALKKLALSLRRLKWKTTETADR